MTTTESEQPARPQQQAPTETEREPARRRTGPAVLRGSSVPARWRITGWIVLTTMIALVAVTLTARNIFLNEVEQSANTEVEQEVDEFERFAGEGLDPSTALPFESAERLITVYLSRQSVGSSEALVGMIDGEVVELSDAAEDRSGSRDVLVGDPDLLSTMSGEDATSGVVENSDGGPVRWGRVDFIVGESTGSLLIAQFTRTSRAEVDAAMVTIGWVAVGGLLLSSVIAWLVAGQILGPIRAVHRVARDITEHDLTARVPVSGRDDIAAVAGTFNEMLDRIERASSSQHKFVDDATRELRTPIRTARKRLSELDSAPMPADGEASIRVVDGELARMGRIVSDLRVLATAEDPDFVTIATVDVAAVTHEIAASASALGDRNWTVAEVAHGDAEFDRRRIVQAVLQLAENAVQYTSAGDTIRLGSRFEGEGDDRRVDFWVADSGPGVESEEASRIFERFRHGTANDLPRADARDGGRGDGAGLGLAVVRAIADAHGGTAWLDSTPGEGASFGVKVPAGGAAR